MGNEHGHATLKSMALIVPIIASMTFASPAPFEAWAEFSKNPALHQGFESVQVGTLGSDRGRLHYWLRRTVKDGDKETITWSDSLSCATVRPVLAAMRNLPAPRPAPYGFDQRGDITLDGVGYMLRTPARFGPHTADLTIRSNVNTPLAQWIETSLTALAPCWSSKVPGRTVR